eukprot:COSAG03_NODE_605_length_6748_cov_9.478869_5_plen_67_part_00
MGAGCSRSRALVPGSVLGAGRGTPLCDSGRISCDPTERAQSREVQRGPWIPSELTRSRGCSLLGCW